ncbi:MAG: hypothetical protein OXG82_08380 [Gammaproteobacteria bacterium]|nr:hypothetical protein [Gammaproteobacteria bacterium]
MARPLSERAAPFAKGVWWVGSMLAITTTVVILWQRDATPGAPDPCLDAPDTARAEILFDLTKPVRPGTLATGLLDVSRRLPTGVELHIRAVVAANAPTTFLGGLCRSYDNEALQVTTAKDGQAAPRDCQDLPAQLSPALRVAASAYCTRRAAVAGRLEAMAASERPVDTADLMGAIERSVRELGAGTLFIVSDMLQHTTAYSHLDLDPTEWAYTDFAASLPGPPGPRPPGLRVHVLYTPRLGLTDAPRASAAHRSFWRAYFDPADVVFEDRAPLPAYVATPRMDIEGEAAAVAQQRAEIERRYRDAAQELARVLDQTEALTRENRDTAAANETLAAEVADVRRSRLAATAERHSLQDEWASRVASDDDPSWQSESLRVAADTACSVRLRPEFAADLDRERYLGGRGANYGAGEIVVRYAVSADGVPLAATLVVDRDRSAATRPQHFAALAADATRLVGSWRFQVDCAPTAGVGTNGYAAEATVSYRLDCVGAPIPACRTMFADAVP